MKTYKSPSGSVIAVLKDNDFMPYGINQLLYSPYGIDYYQVKAGGGRSSSYRGACNYDIKFSVPTLEISDEPLSFSNEVVTSGIINTFCETFISSPVYVNTKHVIPLPKVMQTVYSFKVCDEDFYVYVDTAKYADDYSMYRVFVGTMCKRTEVEITSFDRYKDGGTTIIKTTAGVLYVPSPFRPDLVAIWNDKKLIEG